MLTDPSQSLGGHVLQRIYPSERYVLVLHRRLDAASIHGLDLLNYLHYFFLQRSL